MPADDAATLSEKALSALCDRIAADNAIEDAVKEAVLADLASANPAAFERLRAVLATKGQGDEAEGSEGT
jgi:hypothetical protein